MIMNITDNLASKYKSSLSQKQSFYKSDFSNNRLSVAIDRLILGVGSLFSWFWILTVVAILTSVISRYAFSRGSVMLEEVQWHLAGAAWLIGLSYTFVKDAHVRVDVLHERFSLKTRASVEVIGLSLLFLPFMIITLWELIPYAYSSFQQGERSQAPNGLPHRWALKALMPFAISLLLLAGIGRLIRAISTLFSTSLEQKK